MSAPFKPGMRIRVPWGRTDDRQGRVLEVWGDPNHPSHVRVVLDLMDPEDPDELPSILLLRPDSVTPATAA